MPLTIPVMAIASKPSPPQPRRRRRPPEAYFVVSAIFHYLGPAFAVLLFARVDVLGVAWLRIASAALIFALWRRPWRSVRGAWRLLLAWGAVLAAMNSCFYLAIDRLPLGTVAAIEFLPVIVLAAVGARTPRNLGALALAVPGVYLLTDVALKGDPLGVAFAFVNAALFAAYIVVSHRAAQNGSVPGSTCSGWRCSSPPWWRRRSARGPRCPPSPTRWRSRPGSASGISSSVIPYVTDQLAMARMSRSTYALMVALLPATATVIGIVVLAQLPQRGRGDRRGARDRRRRGAPRRRRRPSRDPASRRRASRRRRRRACGRRRARPGAGCPPRGTRAARGSHGCARSRPRPG